MRQAGIPDAIHTATLFSDVGTLGEQAQNESGCCKTAKQGEIHQARAEAATALAHAIADCHRDDAVLLMSAALSDLSMGAPSPVWLSAIDESRWWASFATEIELKAYAIACFDAMRPSVRAAFLRHVGGNHG